MLQTRNGKRTGTAALRIALDLEREGLVSKDEAVMMVEPRHLDQLLHPLIADGGKKAEREGRVAGRGLAASPGAAVGTAVFSAEAAEAAAKQGRSVILVRKETSPEDVGGKREREREKEEDRLRRGGGGRNRTTKSRETIQLVWQNADDNNGKKNKKIKK
jgi:pyruvate,orthophosphate dikinase